MKIKMKKVILLLTSIFFLVACSTPGNTDLISTNTERQDQENEKSSIVGSSEVNVIDNSSEEKDNKTESVSSVNNDVFGETELLWKSNNPVTLVNNKPIYINFIEDVPEYKLESTNVIEVKKSDYGDESTLLIYSASTLTDFELFTLYPKVGENIEYYKDQVLISLDALTPNTVIMLNTVLPDLLFYNGISFTDSNGKKHVYAYKDNGYDRSFSLSNEIEILIDNEKRDTLKSIELENSSAE